MTITSPRKEQRKTDITDIPEQDIDRNTKKTGKV